MPTMHARARQLADRLAGVGIRAYADPAAAAANLPCVLVTPPRLVLAGDRTATWRLVALASRSLGDALSWDELGDLVDAVDAALPVETAEPGAYALTPDREPLPAYTLTYTEGV